MNLSVKKVLSDMKKIVLIHKFTHSLFIQTLIPRLVSIYLFTMNGPDITFHQRVWDTSKAFPAIFMQTLQSDKLNFCWDSSGNSN